MTHLPGSPSLQIRFPRRIIRVGFATNLLPPQHLDCGRFHQPDRPWFAVVVADYSSEHPVVLALTLEVLLPDPLPALLRVAVTAPPPELPEDSVVHCRKDAF